MSKEVHLLFDDPICDGVSPKHFKRLHCDQANQVPDDNSCSDFSQDMLIPPKWRKNLLNCRKCKRRLVSSYIMGKIQLKLGPQQKFVTGGGFDGPMKNKAMVVTSTTSALHDSTLSCNAEEADMRIWLHVLNSAGLKKN